MKRPAKHFQELWQVFAATKDPKEVKNLLTDILTPQELNALSERIQILKELHKGTPQREIAQKLNVSISTITRGSRVLQFGTNIVPALIERKGNE